MKFGKTLIKNEVVDTDRRWPFFGHLAIVQQIKKRIQTFIILSFGFYCGTLKLLDGN